MYPLDDTIAAVASPPGGAARGIVRISGPEAIECVGRFFQPHGEQSLTPPQASCVSSGSLRLPGLHSPLPCDLYLWCRRSYTGQPVAEIHTVGSPPLLQLLLQSLCAAGARPAGPGEFTLRAFLAGRIDLTQAEAVLGVIDAADRRDLDVALGQLAGGLARPLHRLRNGLLDLLAHVEAGFDFADEDLPFIAQRELDRRLAEAEQDATAIGRQMDFRGEPIQAVKAVLVGRPNTGKSSLWNALAGQPAALVSDRPGTTRDYLIAELDLGGIRCQLIDTAGASGEGKEGRGEGRGERGEGRGERREPFTASPDELTVPLLGTSSAQRHSLTQHCLFQAVAHSSEKCELTVEHTAQSLAAEQRRAADVELLCLDSTRPLDDWERSQLQTDTESGRIVVLTKCDAPRGTDCNCVAVETSAMTGQGIESLRGRLRETALAAGSNRGETVAGTAARCRDSLRLAGECLGQARRAASAGQEELVAAELHVALHELGKVTGAVYADDVLDRIFSRFCVGK